MIPPYNTPGIVPDNVRFASSPGTCETPAAGCVSRSMPAVPRAAIIPRATAAGISRANADHAPRPSTACAASRERSPRRGANADPAALASVSRMRGCSVSASTSMGTGGGTWPLCSNRCSTAGSDSGTMLRMPTVPQATSAATPRHRRMWPQADWPSSACTRARSRSICSGVAPSRSRIASVNPRATSPSPETTTSAPAARSAATSRR